VVRSRPRSAAALYDLARAHFFLGETAAATRLLRKACRLNARLETQGFLACAAAFDPAIGQGALLRNRRSFSAALSRRFGSAKTGVRPRKLGETLRVGYVSSFFHAENWMKPVWALIDHHDRKSVEVHLFSDSARAKEARRRAGVAVAKFHDIFGLRNREAVRRIEKERLDVLVDLNGYSKMGRFPIFLARPAPVVVAWFNIFGTTGMDCFDALIGDGWVFRRGEERWYSERVIRLPMSYLTFEVTYPVPRVAPPPCLKNGFITFGSLAPLYKLNDRVVEAWAEILKRSPKSRLLLANGSLADQGNRGHTLARFAALGISPDRLVLAGGAPHREFLRRYAEIDISLDTFPYNGGTTTTESLWQGVPVLTFSGDRWISRTSASLLINARLREFVCRDLRAYIEAAARWGNSRTSPAKLRALRMGMRARLKRSSVCDAAKLARSIEAVYGALARSAACRDFQG
jgi:predicted O-linked N-acetylglucosamine transferase (SPINDLY family)